MANQQRIAEGFPFPVFVNETDNKDKIAPGVYVNEEITVSADTLFAQSSM